MTNEEDLTPCKQCGSNNHFDCNGLTQGFGKKCNAEQILDWQITHDRGKNIIWQMRKINIAIDIVVQFLIRHCAEYIIVACYKCVTFFMNWWFAQYHSGLLLFWHDQIWDPIYCHDQIHKLRSNSTWQDQIEILYMAMTRSVNQNVSLSRTKAEILYIVMTKSYM